jgi:hypothetical protein
MSTIVLLHTTIELFNRHSHSFKNSGKCLAEIPLNFLEHFVSDSTALTAEKRKFNGISAKHFPLFLKEWEWRLNNSIVVCKSTIVLMG